LQKYSCDILNTFNFSQCNDGFYILVGYCWSASLQLDCVLFQSLVVVLVLSWLDYCNSTLAGLPANLIRRLQSVQNAAVRLIFGIRRSEHITDALASLHWLHIPERILFKVAVLTYPCSERQCARISVVLLHPSR